ncbi:hypothetical protein Bca52824_011582 [Brassica carinata]|uniref:Uncharacterized protein n=1 Tax=Brassica carinata TaxID=52824 RepID=A0A8X8AZJ9_BRACI|nr:hypothetical protein Bca52824_011582 [Brassica carinata]
MEEIDHLADERNKAEFDVEEMKIVRAVLHALLRFRSNRLRRLRSAAAAERRHSPTWSFRWDNYNRGCVAGDDTSLGWLSMGLVVAIVDIKSDFVSSQGSLLDSFRTHTLQNSPPQDTNNATYSK